VHAVVLFGTRAEGPVEKDREAPDRSTLGEAEETRSSKVDEDP